jgi:hypothetical protein
MFSSNTFGPRLYSIANTAARDVMESKVSIVISHLSYHVGSVLIEEIAGYWKSPIMSNDLECVLHSC